MICCSGACLVLHWFATLSRAFCSEVILLCSNPSLPSHHCLKLPNSSNWCQYYRYRERLHALVSNFSIILYCSRVSSYCSFSIPCQSVAEGYALTSIGHGSTAMLLTQLVYLRDLGTFGHMQQRNFPWFAYTSRVLSF